MPRAFQNNQANSDVVSFPPMVPNRTSNSGINFSLQSPEFYGSIRFEIRKDWSVDFAKL